MGKRQDVRWEDMDKSDIDLATLIYHFEVNNKTEGKSPRTVGWYNEVLGMFYKWLQEQGMPTSLRSIGETTVRQFILYIQARPGRKGPTMSSYSVANRVMALKAFFSWLAYKQYTDDNVLQSLRTPATEDLIVEPLTTEEINRLLSAINSDTALGARNASLFSLMLDTGIRLSEAANLKERNVHLEARYIKVMGKGSKERFVSFGMACQRALLHYYHHFRVGPAHDGVDTFFLSIDGYPMSPAAIQSMIRRLARSTDVPRLHPHLLRHTYATMFLLNGGNVFLLQQNLGHSTLSMVQHYLHIAGQMAAVQSQGFSPLDRMNVKDGRRFRHGLDRQSNMKGLIYPNAGVKRTSRRRGRVATKGKGPNTR